jgi:ribosome-associated protein
LDAWSKLKLILTTLASKKAELPVVIDLRNLTAISDFFVIVSAGSDTHARTLADAVRKALKEKGILPFSLEGYDTAGWILMDYGDVMVHIFQPPVRELYSLESLWMDAPRVDVSELIGEGTKV